MPKPLEATYVGPSAGGKPDRLIVLCHGIHADAGQLRQLVDIWRRELPTAAFALPNAPWRRRQHWLGPILARRREWFSIHDKGPAAYEAGVRSAASLLNDFIDAELERLALPSHAYALAGYSQGAMTALFTGLRRAAAPCAIVAIAGSLIAPDRLREEIRNTAPVLLLHGADDQVVPPASSQSAAKLLTEIGIPVEALYRSHLGHAIDDIQIRESALFLKRTLTAGSV
jgi:phospholipase/carboxylesterase